MATVIVAIIVFGLVGLIIGKGIYDKKHQTYQQISGTIMKKILV